jgi:hypothetical protein
MKKIAKATCVLGVLGAVFFGGALVLTACVDGTTPDCSSPEAGCNPSAVEPDAATDGDATATNDGPTADTGADTAADTAAADTGADGGDAADGAGD